MFIGEKSCDSVCRMDGRIEYLIQNSQKFWLRREPSRPGGPSFDRCSCFLQYVTESENLTNSTSPTRIFFRNFPGRLRAENFGRCPVKAARGKFWALPREGRAREIWCAVFGSLHRKNNARKKKNNSLIWTRKVSLKKKKRRRRNKLFIKRI